MCGRFTLDIDERFYPRFNLDRVLIEFPSSYNIAPGQSSVVILNNNEDKNKPVIMKWGLAPSDKFQIINAKIETLDEKFFFKKLIDSKRCIVPASGFYEWKQIVNDKKEPMYIKPEDDSYFAFAGLYDEFIEPKTNTNYFGFTIITTRPNKLIGSIHDRMPLILNKEFESIWLKGTGDKNIITDLKAFSPSENISYYKVSPLVNSPKNTTKGLIKEIH